MLNFGKKKFGTLLVLLILGLLFIIFGAVFIDLVDLVVHSKIAQYLPLRNGTIAYKFWQKPPVPIKFEIYVFHIANPDEIKTGVGVPGVIEKGPYVYRMHIEKTDIIWHDNNTVEYIQPQLFVFDREASVGPDTDTFLTLNIPYITVATLLQYEFSWLQRTVDAYFRTQNESAFMKRSVSEIWWGYQDPVLEEVAKIMHKFNKSSPLFNGKFGFFMDRNNTGDGLYNVFSGLSENFDNYVHIDRWNGKRNLSVWKTDYANEIRGTDGSMQAPFVNENSNLSIFDAYLHRSLNLQYDTTSSYEGIRTLRFRVPYSEFANAIENPDNEGFCTPDCIPSGAYNMSVVCNYAPIYVSLPHFVGGDPYYQTQVVGLNPSQDKHQPYYDIQAMTGISMAAARRYQINVRTQSFQYFTQFEHFPVSYLPILWINGVAEIDKDTASTLKELIQDPLDAMPVVRWTVTAVGGILIIITIGLFIYWRKKSLKNLHKYKKIVDSEHCNINEERRQSYGATRSPLNTQPEDFSNQYSVTNDEVTPSTNTVITNGDISSFPNVEAPKQENFPDQSHYFDPKSSSSTDHNEKYHSFN